MIFDELSHAAGAARKFALSTDGVPETLLIRYQVQGIHGLC